MSRFDATITVAADLDIIDENNEVEYQPYKIFSRICCL